MKFETLYHKGKLGAIYRWDVSTEGDVIVTLYGQIGGKMQEARKRATPKNVGKSNATTGARQAEREAQAMWTHKVERKYAKTPDEACEPLTLPMLAHKYEAKRLADVAEFDVQRKYNGLRTIAVKDADGEVTLLSRGGKVWNIPHIKKLIEVSANIPNESILDGEIYLHGTPLQKINSWVKKLQPATYTLEYHVYDVPRWAGVDDSVWSKRRANVHYVGTSVGLPIVAVETFACSNEKQVRELAKGFIANGYEGAIIRLPDTEYLFGPRSYGLLKYKEFQDGEFVVTGWKTGVGKYENVPTFSCLADNGKSFDTTPIGTMAERKELLDNADSYIGKKLTVRYFDLTPDGVPFHGVGVAFRLDEDLPLKDK